MLLGSNRRVRVFACTEAVDLRKGYDGLYGLVATRLGHDPLSGDLFLFLGRTRKLCKVLMWDGTGLCIFQKRLERGRFANLHATRSDGQTALTLTASELSLFIEGCNLVGRRPLSPDVIVPMSALAAQATRNARDARDVRPEHRASSVAR
jgi:transposase